jgi:hypothetical protein
MKKLILTIPGLLILGWSVMAQYPNVKIGAPINSGGPNEPCVGISYSNPDEIVIGANPNNYYISRDGGATWTHGNLRSSYGVNCDPVIISDNQGAFYYFHLVPDLSRLVCQKTTNIGSDWTDGSYTALNGTMDIDKEWAAFDPVTGNLYVTWTQFNQHGSLDPRDSTIIFLSRSEDRGATWSNKVRISTRGGNSSGGFQSVHGSWPAAGPNGEVYVCWWSPLGLMFDKSTDQGRTWLAADKRLTQPVQWIYDVPGMQLTPSFPNIRADCSSGRYRGSIYINWSEKRNGSTDSDIWIINSRDGGTSWSAPKKVNNDPAGKHQFFNSLAVDPVTGYLYIAFYDRRNYLDNQTDVYLAISRDGGSTFENILISQSPFTPYSTAFFGHYLSVEAFNNRVFIAWSRMDNGLNSIWGCSLNMSENGIEPLTGENISLEQNNPNPFHECTFFSFKLREASEVTVQVSDMFGRCVKLLAIQEPMAAGKHTLRFDPAACNLSPGTYYYTLITQKETLSRKMLYLN